MSQQNKDRTTWIGVSLLVIGLIYLNKNFHWEFFSLFNYLPFDIYSWEIILIIVGLLLLLCGRSSGVFIMLIGAFFLFTEDFIMVITQFHEWWPVALIIVGVIILAKSTSTRKVSS